MRFIKRLNPSTISFNWTIIASGYLWEQKVIVKLKNSLRRYRHFMMYHIHLPASPIEISRNFHWRCFALLSNGKCKRTMRFINFTHETVFKIRPTDYFISHIFLKVELFNLESFPKRDLYYNTYMNKVLILVVFWLYLLMM